VFTARYALSPYIKQIRFVFNGLIKANNYLTVCSRISFTRKALLHKHFILCVWRRLHNEKLYALYSSPNTIRVIKSRRMRWAGHVARMGEMRCACRVLVGRPEGKRPRGRPKRRWIILKWIFKNWDG
jgi:hypothetical protein